MANRLSGRRFHRMTQSKPEARRVETCCDKVAAVPLPKQGQPERFDVPLEMDGLLGRPFWVANLGRPFSFWVGLRRRVKYTRFLGVFAFDFGRPIWWLGYIIYKGAPQNLGAQNGAKRVSHLIFGILSLVYLCFTMF